MRAVSSVLPRGLLQTSFAASPIGSTEGRANAWATEHRTRSISRRRCIRSEDSSGNMDNEAQAGNSGKHNKQLILPESKTTHSSALDPRPSLRLHARLPPIAKKPELPRAGPADIGLINNKRDPTHQIPPDAVRRSTPQLHCLF